MSSDRPDLLATLAAYPSGPSREVRRAERWRRRGATTPAIARTAEGVARRLAGSGLRTGDRVGLYLNDGPLWIAGFFGVLRAGGVALPLDPSLPVDLVRRAASELELQAWIQEGEVADLRLDLPRIDLDWSALHHASATPAGQELPWPDPDPDRIAEIVLTSGTSGLPKAVTIRHRNLRAVLDPFAAEVARYRRALRLFPLRIAASLPLSHLYGQVMGVFLPVYFGAHTMMIPPMSGPELARLLAAERVSVLATVPRTLALLGRTLRSAGEERWGEEGFRARLEAAAGRPWHRRWLMFAGVRRLLGWRMVAVVTGGAAIDPEIEELWRRLGYLVIQGYGLTEAAPLVTINHPFHTALGSLGKPLPGVEVRIAGDGEILVRGANVAPQGPGDSHVDTEGWLHTGDLGRRDAEGRLHYLGRKGDRIVTPAGVNIDPEPLAVELRRQAGIIDAVVVERPWGARGVVCAVVTAHPGADVASAIQRVNDRFPDAARIRAWELWPDADFPRTPTGKARRRPILAWLEDRAPSAEKREDVAAADAGARRERQLTDPYAALARMVGQLAGSDPDRLGPDLLLADALTSLDRVELASLLESAYGIRLADEAIAGHRTLGELARDLERGGREERAEPRMPAPAEDVEAGEARSAAEEARSLAEEASPAPARKTHSIDPAPWRTWAMVRATRFALREAVMRPLLALFVRIEVRGREHLAALEPPFLVASNHASLMDPAAIVSSLPGLFRGRMAPAARWSFFTQRGVRGALEYWASVLGFNTIPLVQVGDWRPTLALAGSLADRGYGPLIFPEGERSRDGALGDFQLGVALIAQNLHLPMVPCAVAGLFTVLPRVAYWPRRPGPMSRAPVAVCFGPALPPPRAGDNLENAVGDLRARIAALHEQALAIAGRP